MSKRPGKVSLSAKFMQADKASFGAIRANTLRLGSALETVVAKKVQVTESMAVKKVQVNGTLGVNSGTDSSGNEKMVIGNIASDQSPQIELFKNSQTVTGSSDEKYQTSISGDVNIGGQIHTLKEIRGRDKENTTDSNYQAGVSYTYNFDDGDSATSNSHTVTGPFPKGAYVLSRYYQQGYANTSEGKAKKEADIKRNPVWNAMLQSGWGLPQDTTTGASAQPSVQADNTSGTGLIPNVVQLNTRDHPGVVFINGRIYSGVKESFQDTQETLAFFDKYNQQKLAVHGTIHWYKATGDSGELTSDDRLKHNETKITGALDTVNKLNPMVYDKTMDMLGADFKGPLDPHKTPFFKESGFIAQDVEQIPELKHMVTPGTSTTPYSLNYNGFIAYLVKAVQELSTKVEEQGAELRALQNGSSSSST